MSTVKRARRHAQSGGKFLTPGQEFELMFDLLPAGDTGFSSRDDAERAWFLHRDRLLEAMPQPFTRPAAYWKFEADGFIPCCKKTGYESERSALLRFGLELTGKERSILAREERKT